MICFVLLFVVVGFALAFYFQNVNILYVAVILSLIINLFSFWYSDKIALKMAGAREITKNEYPEFWNVAENLSITAGLPMPKLYVINDPIPNAFATGRDKNHSAIASTTGILSMLNKAELEGVVAHELSHIGNRDILLSTIVVILVSAISFLSQIFFNSRLFGGGRDRENNGGLMLVLSIFAIILAPIAATIIQLSISRKREFLADASGAILTRYPEGLASALQKISQFSQPLQHANSATAHMYIVNPMGLNGELKEDEEEKISWFTKIFMTHPPVKERIKALLGEK